MALVMSSVGPEQRELIGIAVQRQQAVADQVDRGLVARAEQEDDIGGQFPRWKACGRLPRPALVA